MMCKCEFLPERCMNLVGDVCVRWLWFAVSRMVLCVGVSSRVCEVNGVVVVHLRNECLDSRS